MSRAPQRRSGLHGVWTNRHALGVKRTQTRAPLAGIVTAEGGGFIPTLFWGGGTGFFWILGLSSVACEPLFGRARAGQGGLP